MSKSSSKVMRCYLMAPSLALVYEAIIHMEVSDRTVDGIQQSSKILFGICGYARSRATYTSRAGEFLRVCDYARIEGAISLEHVCKFAWGAGWSDE
jgi:hypothetical protein